jgi:xylan 1,4-beta-xylosidase
MVPPGTPAPEGRNRLLLFAGDYPDPALLFHDGRWYCVHSSFEWAPGLLLWTSTDLLTWEPLAHALPQYDGDVWAPDLSYHDGEFLIYYRSSFGSAGARVVTARDPRGPWSAPADVGIGWVDPAHVVADDGSRWIHVSDGFAARLQPDGRRIAEPPFRTIEPWPIPPGLPHEGVWLEGPKVFRHAGAWHYIASEGGTAGPATSHMVLHARGPTAIGPWTWSSRNPVIRTRSRREPWWSVGHGTVFQDPQGQWWTIAHGYRRGYHTLGRQTLLIPVAWDAAQWLHETERVLPRARGSAVDPAIEDHFSGPELGLHWRSWKGRAVWRCGYGLDLDGGGTSLGTTAPLTVIPGHVAYEIIAEMELLAAPATGGICLFYHGSAFYALGVRARDLVVMDAHGEMVASGLLAGDRPTVFLKIVNDQHEVTTWYSGDGVTWIPCFAAAELSGYHHNVFKGFLALRAGLFAYQGTGRFRSFRYRGLAAGDEVGAERPC